MTSANNDLQKRRVLYLHLKRKYFLQVKQGIKSYEYRRITPYWEKLLSKMRPGDCICIMDGYPPRNDKKRRIPFPWDGFKRILLKHEEFVDESAPVFAIRLNPSKKRRDVPQLSA